MEDMAGMVVLEVAITADFHLEAVATVPTTITTIPAVVEAEGEAIGLTTI